MASYTQNATTTKVAPTATEDTSDIGAGEVSADYAPIIDSKNAGDKTDLATYYLNTPITVTKIPVDLPSDPLTQEDA